MLGVGGVRVSIYSCRCQLSRAHLEVSYGGLFINQWGYISDLNNMIPLVNDGMRYIGLKGRSLEDFISYALAPPMDLISNCGNYSCQEHHYFRRYEEISIKYYLP